MGIRAEALADRLEQGARVLLDFVAALPESEWQNLCADEGRAVSVMAHHVASAYLVEMDLVRVLATGQPIAGVTWDMIHELNAKHADTYAGADRQQTLALLLQNSREAANAVRALSDEQLDRAAPVSLHWEAPLTAQYFIEEHTIAHSYRHLASIRAAVTAAI